MKTIEVKIKTNKTESKEISPNGSIEITSKALGPFHDIREEYKEPKFEDIAWIRGETAYLLASIKSISSSIKSYTVDDKKKYYFEVNDISCTYLDKKQAYKEYSDLVDRLNKYHTQCFVERIKE